MTTEYRTLGDAVRTALAELNKAYNDLAVPPNTTISMRDLAGLIYEYSSDANLQSITEHFTSAANSIALFNSNKESCLLALEKFPC